MKYSTFNYRKGVIIVLIETNLDFPYVIRVQQNESGLVIKYRDSILNTFNQPEGIRNTNIGIHIGHILKEALNHLIRGNLIRDLESF